MDIVLPKEIAYSPSLPALPECQSIDVVLSPVNGGSFGPSSLIQFDLVSRGFIEPGSMYLRYKYTLTNSTTETSVIKCTPVFSLINKLETIFGSSVVESINNFHQVANLMVNLQQDVAMKYGQQSAYGWSTGGTPTLQELDGRTCVNNEVGAFAAPLPCILSMAEKLIPAGLMPNIRIQLTTASISEAFLAATPPTNYALSNVELCYSMVDFNGDVNELVKNMGDQFYIKTTSFKNMGATLSSGITGSVELVYNMRLASIKSLFALFSGQNARCVNGVFDSVDVTSSNGEYVFNIAGVSYPNRPISTLNNKASVLMELKKAVGALHSESYNSSINTVEFNSVDATTTTALVPGKFYFGVNTEKLSSNGALLTGVSTQNSPINLRISTGSATTQAYTCYLVAMYDALIAVEPQTRNASIKE
jgi:hypothetical protein